MKIKSKYSNVKNIGSLELIQNAAEIKEIASFFKANIEDYERGIPNSVSKSHIDNDYQE